MTTIHLENIGPVAKLSLPIPQRGGVVVLRGRNGSGKSTVLEAAQSLIRGKGALEARDGTHRGEVSGWGARITVGRQTRRSGELEVVSLEGRLDIAQLVDPGIADQAAADARRIKALASLTGATACQSRFAELFGGVEELESILPATAIPEDLVEAAGKIKRAAEAEARKRETQAEGLRAKAVGLLAASKDVDMTQEADTATLQAALEAAVGCERALQAERKVAEAARTHANEARIALEKAGSVVNIEAELNLEEATRRDAALKVERLDREISETLRELARLQTQLGKLRAERAAAEEVGERSTTRTLDLKRTQSAMAGWRNTIEAAEQAENPCDDELESAALAVTRAREAIEVGAVVRRARQNTTQAAEMQTQAAREADIAAQLREAAQRTDDVLSAAVACELLRVEAGRLVTDTRRGVTCFSDLSQGERWAIALRLAAQRVGESGVIPVPQEAWEGLDPDNRAMVANLASSLGVVILTAEADCGELRAESYMPHPS